MSWGQAISYIQEDFTEKHQKLNTPFKFTDYYFTKYNFKINDNKYKLHACKGYYIMNPEDKKLTYQSFSNKREERKMTEIAKKHPQMHIGIRVYFTKKEGNKQFTEEEKEELFEFVRQL